jgi:hypothetical protein
MTCRGHVKNGQITLDAPLPFPEGAEVIVALIEKPQANSEDLKSLLLRHAGRGENLPKDLAEQHDHYAHGKPKR